MKNEAMHKAGCQERHRLFSPLQDSSCMEWSERYAKMKTALANGGMYAFIGKRGTGKTQMAVSLIGHFIYNLGKSCKYTEAYDIYESIKQSFAGGELKEARNRKNFVDPDVLVIDALEVRAESAFENRELNYILNKRYGYPSKITILISNDTKQSFADFVGTSTVSRMDETGGFITFNGKSFRE